MGDNTPPNNNGWQPASGQGVPPYMHQQQAQQHMQGAMRQAGNPQQHAGGGAARSNTGRVHLPPMQMHPAQAMHTQMGHQEPWFDFVPPVQPQVMHGGYNFQQQQLPGTPPAQYQSFVPPGGLANAQRTPVRLSDTFQASLVHSATPKARPQPPQPPQPPPKSQQTPAPAQGTQDAPKKSRATGQGARSGANRRNAGGSDDEIQELTPAQLKQAAVKTRTIAKNDKKPSVARMKWSDEQLLFVVSTITEATTWVNFKLTQASVFDKIVAHFVKDSVLVDRSQVQSLWERTFTKYKKARRLIDFTGGAGDAEAPAPKAPSTGTGEVGEKAGEKDGAEKDSADDDKDDADNDDNDGTADKKRKRTKKAEDEQYSAETLRAFTKTKVYEAIDAVAHDDPEVVRPIPYGSAEPIKERPSKKSKRGKNKSKRKNSSDTDDSSGGEAKGDIAGEVVALIKTRNKQQMDIDKQNLDLMKARSKREEQMAEMQREAGQWQREDREHARAVAEKEQQRADERLRMERERHEREELAEYERCMASPDPLLQMRAQVIRERLGGARQP